MSTRFARESVRGAPDASAALGFMVRLFMGREKLPTAFKFRESMLWPAYTAHVEAWREGVHPPRARDVPDVFVLALEAHRCRRNAARRATSVHNYLTGAMVRNMVEPLDREEIARAVTALSDVGVDPAHC